MAQGGDEGAEKSHEPTQKKLDDARKKGEIARSTDLNVALSYFGVWLFVLSVGAAQTLDFGDTLQHLMSFAFINSSELMNGAGMALFGPYFLQASIPFAVFAAIPAALILLALIAQRALLFTPSKLKPKMSRVSILQNAKNKFGRGGLFEFAKSFVKLTIFSISLAVFLMWNLDVVVGSAMAEAQTGITAMFMLITSFLVIVVIVSAAIAAIDVMWQIQEHRRKNMMSHKEVRDEVKESEGDPYLKQARRSKAQEVALNQMMGDVPKADVIVVNPTHYAVALKWSGGRHEAPRCVAKGVDDVAMRIRAVATDAKVPIYSDPPTARALHAVVEIGDEIHPDHYAAVAVAIRFSEELKKKKR